LALCARTLGDTPNRDLAVILNQYSAPFPWFESHGVRDQGVNVPGPAGHPLNVRDDMVVGQDLALVLAGPHANGHRLLEPDKPDSGRLVRFAG
jgi:hypothetical protein